MDEDNRWHKRRKGSGLLLLLFLIAMLGLPLWHWRNLHHPLMDATVVDLCGRLGTLPLIAGLPAEPIAGTGSAGACRWPGPYGKVHLEAMLVTARSSGGGIDFARRFDVWRDELRATHGPGTHLRESGDEGERVLKLESDRGNERLIEDRGVLLDLRSQTLDSADLDRLIAPAKAALRAAKPA